MGKLIVSEDCNGIKGLKVITPEVHGDDRGYFVETYNYNDFAAIGIDCQFVQDNQSASKKGVLRGLHSQKQYPQDKLVRVIKGEVFDVAVDLRPGSKTYGKWEGVILTEENKKMFMIPRGFAHGFVVLSEFAQFQYKVDNVYAPQAERTLRFDDEALGIDWKVEKSQMLLSEKDLRGIELKNIKPF